jgi:K+-transporting ATPase KdpF subunit
LPRKRASSSPTAGALLYALFTVSSHLPSRGFTPSGAHTAHHSGIKPHGHYRSRHRHRDLRVADPVRYRLRKGVTMFDLLLGGVLSAGMLVYLVWALLRPEDF